MLREVTDPIQRTGSTLVFEQHWRNFLILEPQTGFFHSIPW